MAVRSRCRNVQYLLPRNVDGRRDGGDHVGLQPAQLELGAQQVGAAIGHQEPDQPDDAELGAFMDQLPESQVKIAQHAHSGDLPSRIRRVSAVP